MTSTFHPFRVDSLLMMSFVSKAYFAIGCHARQVDLVLELYLWRSLWVVVAAVDDYLVESVVESCLVSASPTPSGPKMEAFHFERVRSSALSRP